jgi:serine/threonine-protein kinase
MVALAPSNGSDLALGDIIEGRYQVLRKLADGGMGTVYLAEHVLIRRRVALKVLHAELASDSLMVRRFMNEASAAGTLGHPHIVESTDMGFTRHGIPYIVFEYLEGCLLLEEVYRLGGLPVRRALGIASQIASALEVAHAAKIIHLDLKSDNVFLIDRGDAMDHVKVLDFGISRFLESELDRSQRGLMAGTPEFMAPEQVTMPDHIDGRADIYALGVLIYEMLTARCPHVHVDRHQVLHRIVHEPPPPLDRVVPPALERLLFDRLLAKSREHRLQTMREVKAALDEIAAMQRTGTAERSPLPRPRALEWELRGSSSDPSLFAFDVSTRDIEVSFCRALPSAQERASLGEAELVSDAVVSRDVEPVPRAIARHEPEPVSEMPVRSASEHDAALLASAAPSGDGAHEATARDAPMREVALPRSAPSGQVPVLAPVAALSPATVRRRPRSWSLVIALLAGLAGGTLWLAEREEARTASRAARSALEVDIANLSRTLVLEMRTAHERAADLAGAPLVRDAIDTHARAVARAVSDEQAHAHRGEQIEIVRTTGGRTVLLREPPTGPALVGEAAGDRATTRLVADDARLLVIASAPVRRRNGDVGGTVATAAPIDIALVARLFGDETLEATLVGLDRPVPLLRAPHADDGIPEVVPITLEPDDEPRDLAVVATLAPPAAREDWVELRTASWAFGGAMLVIYTLSWLIHGLRRGRKPARAV